mgnify:CR=1 FL=1
MPWPDFAGAGILALAAIFPVFIPFITAAGVIWLVARAALTWREASLRLAEGRGAESIDLVLEVD